VDAINPAGTDFGERITSIREKANECLEAAQKTAKAYFDRKRGKSWTFNDGDLVWLEATNIKLSLGVKKLAPKRYGPFAIIGKHGLSSYELKLPSAWSRLHPIFNEALLSPYQPPSTPDQSLAHAPPPAIIVDDVPEFEVDSVNGFKMMRKRPFYKVHWKGYPSYDDTWEPLSNLDHAKDAIADFHAAHPRIRKPLSVRFASTDSAEDVILAIHPSHVTNIISGFKTCEFRKYRLSPDVRFLWLYETAPVFAIRYVLEVDSVLLPGQLSGSGLGTDDFNAGLKASKFAYPILRSFRLPAPISCSELHDLAIVPPHRWCPSSPSFALRFGPLVR
jgi:hypothetical protein